MNVRRVLRPRPVAGVVVVVAVGAAAVWGLGESGGEPAVEHQSAAEIEELGPLPDELTPLDPDNPNPTGDDPLAIGAPPEFEPASTPEEFLARAEQRAAAAPPAPPARGGEPAPAPRTDPHSLLVTFAPGTPASTIAGALDAVGVTGTPLGDTGVVEVDTGGQDHATLTEALEGTDTVEAVGPNHIREAGNVPNDPELAAQAPYLNTARLPGAWEVADTAGNVVVAVLDTGVDLDHPDLAPNLVPGHDFVNNDAIPMDDHGHGTQVAGVIGAVTGNGVGVAGVAWNARIMPVKVLGADGFGADAAIVAGIRWAADNGADVINMSFGATMNNPVLETAVDYALQREVVLVASAGNSASLVNEFPAAYPGVLGVTATDAGGRFAWFSNHGPAYLLAAPGIGIRTTALTAGTGADYTAGTGTSFSSPVVAGVAALVRERHPGWGWFEVGDLLLRTARDAGPAGVDDAYGFGIVDAAAALEVSPRSPASQPNRTGDAGNLRSSARVIPVGAPASETIGYEYDEDWFAFDVPAAAGATITVTPPSVGSDLRAAELDPVFELYGPGGGLIDRVDDNFPGELEGLRANLAPGRYALRVTNFLASIGPASYSVTVSLGVPLPPTGWAPLRQELNTPTSERAVAVADVTSDGRQDVMLVAGTSLLVLAQTANGTLTNTATLSTHLVSEVVLPLRPADLDGDGDTDIVLGTAEGLDVAWNDGTGLAAPVLYPLGRSVAQIQVGDVDGDGASDLVVPGPAGLDVLTWTGTEFGAEATGIAVSGPTPATGSVPLYGVADFTSDGRVDIAGFVDAGADVAIFAQQQDGGWGGPSGIGLPRDAGQIRRAQLVTGDVTGDGRADLVVASTVRTFQIDFHRLAYSVQLEGGAFGPQRGLQYSGSGAQVQKVGDLTADGRDDLLVVDGEANLHIYHQTLAGTLAAETVVQTSSSLALGSDDRAAIGDLDGDGAGDVAAVGTTNGLYVQAHEASTTVEGPGPWVIATSPAAHATGVGTNVRPSVTFGRDVDPAVLNSTFLLDGRDGHAVPGTVSRSGRTVTFTPASPLQPAVPYVLWAAGMNDVPGFEVGYEQIPFTTVGAGNPRYAITRTLRPVAVDLDGNGFDDIFWHAPGSAVDSVWFFGTDGRTAINTQVSGSYTPVVGDFDGNSYEDILWYAPGSGTDVLWLSSRTGITARTVNLPGVYVPLVADFDRNGYDDIFWYGPGTSGDAMWSFRAGGVAASVRQTVNGTYRPATGDFNRDGYGDVVWYGPGSIVESWWRGSASGFVKGTTMPVIGSYRTLPLDFNADGFDEVFFHTTNRGLFWRSGTSGFASTSPGPSVPSTVRPIAGDFTGDLRDDLIAYVPGTAADPFYRGTSTGVS